MIPVVALLVPKDVVHLLAVQLQHLDGARADVPRDLLGELDFLSCRCSAGPQLPSSLLMITEIRLVIQIHVLLFVFFTFVRGVASVVIGVKR